jgi:hypothetical protein
MADQVDHYSVRANRWTLSFAPDLPLNASYFLARTDVSFRNRPQMPVHPYRAFAYDRPSGKMLYLDRAYDVAARDWDPEPYPGLEHNGVMHSMLEATPQGVVCLSGKGLFRFEWARKSWIKLPWNGAVKPADVWCDGGSVCYDSKRDCLWWGTEDLNRYDLKTGNVERVNVRIPKWMKFSLVRDPVYVPGADLILVAQNLKRPDGTRTHVAFDPAQCKYYAVELPYEEGKTPNLDDWKWNIAQHCDARLGAVLKYVYYNKDLFYALKLDRATLKMTEIPE